MSSGSEEELVSKSRESANSSKTREARTSAPDRACALAGAPQARDFWAASRWAVAWRRWFVPIAHRGESRDRAQGAAAAPANSGASAPLAAVAVIVGLLAAQAQAAARDTGFFRTPSGNIQCLDGYGLHVPAAFLECGIESGLHPAPPRTAADCKNLDYVGNRVFLSATGSTQAIACAGDASLFCRSVERARAGRLASVWHGWGFSRRSPDDRL